MSCRSYLRNPLLVWPMLRDGKVLCLTPHSVAAPWLRDGSMVALPVSIGIKLAPLGFYWQPKRASNAVQQLADALAAVAQRAEPD